MAQSTRYGNSSASYLETKIATESVERRAAGHKQVLRVALAEALALVLRNLRNSSPKAALQTPAPAHAQALSGSKRRPMSLGLEDRTSLREHRGLAKLMTMNPTHTAGHC